MKMSDEEKRKGWRAKWQWQKQQHVWTARCQRDVSMHLGNLNEASVSKSAKSPTHVHGRKTGTTPYCSELINSFLRGQQAFFVIFRSRVKLVQLLNEKQGASNNCYFIKVFVEIQHFSQSIQQQNKSSLLVEKMNTRCYQFFNKERSFQWNSTVLYIWIATHRH